MADRKQYLLIDNRSRDVTLDVQESKNVGGNAAPFQYALSLSSLGVGPITNVKSLTIKAVTMARPQTEDWVSLYIEPSLSSNVYCTDDGTTNATMIIAFENYFADNSSVCVRADNLFGATQVFVPPLPKLDRLNVTFKKFGGLPLTETDFRRAKTDIVPFWDRHTIFMEIVTS